MRRFFATTLAIILGLTASAQKFDHYIDFSYYFDNLEFDRGHETYQESMTIHAARMTPYFGVKFDADKRTRHKLMMGVDIYKDMGDGVKNFDLIDELSLFYSFEKITSRASKFTMAAGVLPRSFSEGVYSRVIFSDATKFLDHNIEGLLLKYRSPRLYSELYCDWMGKYGVVSRERFQINTAGQWAVAGPMSLGWNASMYHYSCSELEHYVVDNALANLYLKLDLSKPNNLDVFYIKSGLLTGYQRDRREKVNTIPIASESILAIGMRNVGIENTFVYAPDMMIYYDSISTDLYYGSPFYHSRSRRPHAYDRLEFYWSKNLSRRVDLKASVIAHFAHGENGEVLFYQGMQQKFTVNVTL